MFGEVLALQPKHILLAASLLAGPHCPSGIERELNKYNLAYQNVRQLSDLSHLGFPNQIIHAIGPELLGQQMENSASSSENHSRFIRGFRWRSS
jgi:hypothetical protein